MAEPHLDLLSKNEPLTFALRRATANFGSDPSLTSYFDGTPLFASTWNLDVKYDLAENISPVSFLAFHLQYTVLRRCKLAAGYKQAQSYPGNLCLMPRELPHAFNWDGKATIMFLLLDPECTRSLISEFTLIDPEQVRQSLDGTLDQMYGP